VVAVSFVSIYKFISYVVAIKKMQNIQIQLFG
jgi:hypothetical protein